MTNRLRVSAPGKIILSGEHAVVYGCPALLSAVNKRLTIVQMGKEKKTESDIPIGRGMGSSAAFAVASSALRIKLRGGKWSLEEINKQAYEMEKKQHGNPSGGDNTISVYGGFLWYRKESEGLKTFSQIKIKRKLPKLFLIDTGRPQETTKEMVTYVSGLYKTKPGVRKLLLGIERNTKLFLKFLLKEENIPFGQLITENERLLEKLGVVSGSTLSLIKKIERMGGAAKISGAGGRIDASGIVIAYHPQSSRLLSFAKDNNLDICSVKLGGKGVRVD